MELNIPRYNQKMIEGIIKKAPVSKKVQLFLRDRMGYFGQGFILNYDQIERLTLSVSPEDRKEWEVKTALGLRIENALKDMSRSLERVLSGRRRLSRILTEIQDFELLEDTLNQLLDPWLWEEENEEETALSLRKHLREHFGRVKGFHLIRPEVKDKTIDLNLQGEKSLTAQALEQRDETRREVWFYLCYEEAVYQALGQFKLRVPEYEEHLKRNREILDETALSPLRFVGVQDNTTFQVGECNLKDRDPQEYPYPSLRDGISDYSTRPQDVILQNEKSLDKIIELFKQI